MKVLNLKSKNLKSKAEALNNYGRAQLVWWYEEKNGLSGPGWWGATAAMDAKGRRCVFFPAFAWELDSPPRRQDLFAFALGMGHLS